MATARAVQNGHQSEAQDAPKKLNEMSREELLSRAIEETNIRVEYVPFGEKEPIKLTRASVKRLIAKPTRKGFWPKDSDIDLFITLCKARCLNPYVSDAFLVGYDSDDGPQFTLITAHQALLKRAELHEQYDGMCGGIVVTDKEGNVIRRKGALKSPGDVLIGGWATVYRKDRSHPTEIEIELGSRKGTTPLWRKDECGMIVKCSKSAGLRETFPNTLGGMYSEEEFDLMQHAEREAARKDTANVAEYLKPKPPQEAAPVESHEPVDEHDEAYQPSPDDEAGGWEPEESEATA